jgi:hypothetical protein
VAEGDSLWRILTREYQIPREALPTFLEAFRSVNPDLDPDHLTSGQVIRVPFKVEENPFAPADEPSPVADRYTVRPGDNLWKILQSHYNVPRERMRQALEAIARANPEVVDLNRLLVGQRLNIPADLAGLEAGPPPLPPSHRTVLGLLAEMGCTVTETGETYLPLGRGRTVQLDARDFPLVTGPSGKRVILDPRRRLSPALAQSVENAWAYRVIQGVTPDPEEQLGRLLPLLGFHEISQEIRTITLERGVELQALPRWSVVPRAEDLLLGRVHLLFPAGSVFDPGLADAARRANLALHAMGSANKPNPAAELSLPAKLDMGDPIEGAARVLSLLGVPHRVRPDVNCDLGGGVRYRVCPELTFRHAGLKYAVPPRAPARAESILFRAGYFTVTWHESASPLNRLGDLLALLGVSHSRTTVEAPRDQALRLRVRGISIEEPDLARILYPARTAEDGGGTLFLTEARLTAETARVLFQEGLLPWVVRTR